MSAKASAAAAAEPTRLTNYFETLAHFVKAYIGAGIFVMGDGYKNSGILIGSIGTVLIGLICTYNDHVVAKMSRYIKDVKNLDRNPTFPETISYAFEMGPPALAKLHRPVMWIMKACIYSSQYLFCVIYVVFVADTLKQLLEEYVINDDLNKRIYVCMTFPVVLAITLIQNLKMLAPISAISVIFILYGIVGTLVYCCFELPHLSERPMVKHVSGWPNLFGIVLFAFAGIAVVIPLQNEMKKPEQMDSPFGIINVGMAISMVSYWVLGFFSFWKYDDEINGSVTLNLPHSAVSESIKASVAFAIMLSYPLQFYIPTKIVFVDILQRWPDLKHPTMIELLLKTGFVIVTYILAVAIPYVEIVVSLVGVITCNMLVMAFPPLADISLRFQPDADDKEGKRKAKFPRNFIRFFLDGVTLVLFVFGLVFGLYTTVLSIIKVSKGDKN